jgi:alpha-N-acetylglucosaminidase
MAERLVPTIAQRFEFELIESGDEASRFEIESEDGKIVLRGTDGVALASALGHYLENELGMHFSRNGDQTRLRGAMPLDFEPVRLESPYRYRFFYNYTTFGYTSAWWGWEEWEREIDLLALDGVNLAMVMPGSEELYRRMLLEHGYTDAEARAWLVMPSHLPWMLMGNMQSFGGPVPAYVMERRLKLGQRIVDRMQALDIEPVLPSFYGMVPDDFGDRYPEVNVFEQGLWVGGFPRPDLVDPTAPMFAELSGSFHRAAAELFPGVRYFSADPFHEGGSTEGVDLSAAAQALLSGMREAHPEPVWVVQAWSGTPKQPMLDALPKDEVLVVLLNGTNDDKWRNNDAFGQTPWVWAAIQNFGGNTGMVAKLSEVAERPAEALSDPASGPLVGLGAVPEATDTIPVAYDLLFDQVWGEPAPVDLEQWIPAYLDRRYGALSRDAEMAWSFLLMTVLDTVGRSEEPHNSVITARPSLNPAIRARTWGNTETPYDPLVMARAWEPLLEAQAEVGSSDGYRFDVADVSRQVLCDLATRHHDALITAYAAGDAEAVRRHGDRILEIIRDLDELAGTRPEWLFGTWLADAREWGSTRTEQDLSEWNARVLLTTWSDTTSSLNDYANREWQGLLSDYYLPRWEIFLNSLYQAMDSGEPFDEEDARDRIAEWELSFAEADGAYPTVPTGDEIEVAETLLAKYGDEAVSPWENEVQLVDGGWNPEVLREGWQTWRMPVPQNLVGSNGLQVEFGWLAGQSALRISQAELKVDGQVWARITKSGWTGIENRDNVFLLYADDIPADAVLEFRVAGASGTDSTGVITLVPLE